MHFDPKKYTKNYKMKVIQKKRRHDKFLSVKKIGKNVGEAQKFGQSCQNEKN